MRLPRSREFVITLDPVWCIPRRTTGGALRHTLRKLPASAETTEHYVTTPIDKNMLWLEITMDDSRCMQALDALNNFRRIEVTLFMAKSAPPRQLRRKVTTGVKVLR